MKYKKIRPYKYITLDPYTWYDCRLYGKSASLPGIMSLNESGCLQIAAGYAWDGASGPTIDTRNSMVASLVHDALYQLIREGQLPAGARRAADRCLRTIAIHKGMRRGRAWAWYYAVRLCGRSAAKPRKPEQEQDA